MNINLYSQSLFDAFDAKLQKGTKKLQADENTFLCVGSAGALECGDLMRLEILVDKKTFIVLDASVKTFGCGSAVSSSEAVVDFVKNKNFLEMRKIAEVVDSEIVKKLSLPPVKIHCSVLAKKTILSAIKDFDRQVSCAKATNEPG